MKGFLLTLVGAGGEDRHFPQIGDGGKRGLHLKPSHECAGGICVIAGHCASAGALGAGTSEKPFGHAEGTLPGGDTRDALRACGGEPEPSSQTSQCAPPTNALRTRPIGTLVLW
jgi:hypothetical protein